MTVQRDNPYMYATWPTRYITGDKSCLWACWYKTHYYRYQQGAQRLRSRALAGGAHRSGRIAHQRT